MKKLITLGLLTLFSITPAIAAVDETNPCDGWFSWATIITQDRREGMSLPEAMNKYSRGFTVESDGTRLIRKNIVKAYTVELTDDDNFANTLYLECYTGYIEWLERQGKN